ncbi:SAM-dependent DNA methyltransferase [Tumidithrix helvetica]|uniref:SAM-dependent DNA methyltransferase n=1 Tax=Tumidithrix helvetica TaxID=3457545 RepID=UPI003CC665EB
MSNPENKTEPQTENQPVGAVFTPFKWATWVLEKYAILDRWLEGATIFDPTAGEGIFLECLINLAVSQGISISSTMLDRLYANEKNAEFIESFLSRMRSQYGINFPLSNFFNRDILFFDRALTVDIVVGNPPWQNFANLTTAYKELIKPLFHEYGLVHNSKDLLLGSSRIDLSSLIIIKTLQNHLRINGLAYFFMPLSVFLNDGASRGFRAYGNKNLRFEVREIYDFKDDFKYEAIFEKIRTRYGLVCFQRDRQQTFPIQYFQLSNSVKNSQNSAFEWQKCYARSLFKSDAPLSISSDLQELQELENLHKIPVDLVSKPRQGINSCGAKDLFVFEDCQNISETLVRVSNRQFQNLILPNQFLFPLVTKANFEQAHPIPQRYILIPYDITNGKPLSHAQLERHPQLWQYLLAHQTALQNRKGTLIQNWIKKGSWYALLGVGIYTFMPYKVCWQAYGQKQFKAQLFEGHWQGNQALHAYMPMRERSLGENLVQQLNAPIVERYLRSQQMEGTCNWAQPGRILQLLELVD